MFSVIFCILHSCWSIFVPFLNIIQIHYVVLSSFSHESGADNAGSLSRVLTDRVLPSTTSLTKSARSRFDSYKIAHDGKHGCSLRCLDMIPTRCRRIFWSTKMSKRATILAVCLLMCGAIWINNVSYNISISDASSDRKLLAANTHVYVPRLAAMNAVPTNRVPAPQVLPHNLFNRVSMHPADAVDNTSIAVLVMSATRPAAIKNHLSQLIQHRPDPAKFPIIVSQDGTNAEVTATIAKFANDSQRVFFIKHGEREGVNSPVHKQAKNYFFIAQHYKYALDKVFKEFGYKTVIITEDDLDIAPDFFSYFENTKRLLYEDRSIWCVSAWNDNGANHLIDPNHPEQLYRTDFFPGLGWMLTSFVWDELSPKWPEAYWDDWLRRQDISRNRVCIRPEVSRTVHNNRLAGKGSSNGLYKSFLSKITLPVAPVDFSLVNLDRLKKSNYDPFFIEQVKNAKLISVDQLAQKNPPIDREHSYRVTYANPREYRKIAKAFSLMNDVRSGMVRTAYYSIVSFVVGGTRIYAVSTMLDLELPFGNEPASAVYPTDWDKMSRYLDFAEFYCKPTKWSGVCDPHHPDMIAWFRSRNQMKRLQLWGDMIVI